MPLIVHREITLYMYISERFGQDILTNRIKKGYKIILKSTKTTVNRSFLEIYCKIFKFSVTYKSCKIEKYHFIK